jgi:hypothetical protein
MGAGQFSPWQLAHKAHGISWGGRVGTGKDAVATLHFLAENFPGFEGAKAAMASVKTVKERATFAIAAIKNRYLEDSRFRDFMDRRFPAVVAGIVGGEAARRAMARPDSSEVPGPMS